MRDVAALALQLFSMVCMTRFVVPCVNDAAEAAKIKDEAASRDYLLMAAIGFLAYVILFVVFT